MRFKNKLLATSLLVGTGLLATPAFAQDQAQEQSTSDQATTGIVPQEAVAAEAAQEGDEIVVTGTLIRNPNLVSSSPVSSLTDNEITLRTPNNAEELLRSIPGVSPSIGAQVNNGSNGTNTVDLRGLGLQRNIVLLNGSRIVPTLANGAVDLNVIPVALVSRVDVLTGGASTTYGADAVSGVVNFITRRDFSGLDARASYRLTERGDGQAYRVDITAGGNFADDRGNAVISFGYTNVAPVYQTRDFSLFGIDSRSCAVTAVNCGVASGSSFTSVPTTFSFADADLQLNPATTALVPQYQGFNFNPFNIFQTPLERKSAYGSVDYEIADGIEFYARGLFASNEISSIIAPSGIFGQPLTINSNNPYLTPAVRTQICQEQGIDPASATCTTNPALPLGAVYRRLVELGPRIGNYQNNLYDVRTGVRFDVTSSTDLDLSLSYGKSEQQLENSGYVLNSRVQQALNATSTTECLVSTGGCVPLNLFGPAGSITAAQVAFLNGSSNVFIDTQLTQARAVYSGDLGFQVPLATQPVSFALGGEYRRYTYDRVPDARAQDPSELGGAGGAVLPFAGGYNVREGFAELIAPIVADRPFFNEVTLEAGIRYSDYAINAPGDPTFDTTTYKVGATWEVIDALRLRGNYQRAVRAPNIAELFSPTSTALTNLNSDPCAGAAPLSNPNLAAVCLAQGAPSVGSIQDPSSGQANATFVYSFNLQPEKADTFTVGVVATPRDLISGLSLSFDYYKIVINDAITFATPGDAIAACFANITAASATNAACTQIRRNPANGRLSGPSATTFGLRLPITNLGRLATDGFDFTANFNRDFGAVGLGLNFVGNYTRSLKFRASPNSVNRECVGYYSANCGPSFGQIQPEFSFNQRTSLSFGGATLSLLWRHLSAVSYEGTASDFAARGFTPDNRFLFNGAIRDRGVVSGFAGEQYNFNEVPAYNYFDLNAQFDIERRYQLTFGVQNLFDKQPPLLGANAGGTGANSGNTFPSTYDPLGRSYSAAVRVKF